MELGRPLPRRNGLRFLGIAGAVLAPLVIGLAMLTQPSWVKVPGSSLIPVTLLPLQPATPKSIEPPTLAAPLPALTTPPVEIRVAGPDGATHVPISGLGDDYRNAVRAAIFANAQPSAAGAPKNPEATVRFSIRDAKLLSADIARSSGDRQIDDAALGAVRAAAIPAPPPALAGRTLVYELPIGR